MSKRISVSIRDAKDQAAEYFGLKASVLIEADGKVFEIPNPGFMDDDQQERWDELQFLLESCERQDDIVIPARELEDGTKVEEQRIPGEFKTPYRIKDADGKSQLLKPPYNARLGMVIFGEKGYAEYKAAGGSGNQIALEWARMNQEYQKRVESDPKSVGSAGPLESVPEGD